MPDSTDPVVEGPSSPKSSKPPFASVPVEVTVAVGRANPTISELLEYRANSVIRLDKGVDDPVDILVGDKQIAQGSLEEVHEGGQVFLAVRLTSVPGLSRD